MTPKFIRIGKNGLLLEYNVRMDAETILGRIYIFSRWMESLLKRAISHLRPQYALVCKKGNLQIMCFLEKGMKSNIIFY